MLVDLIQSDLAESGIDKNNVHIFEESSGCMCRLSASMEDNGISQGTVLLVY